MRINAIDQELYAAGAMMSRSQMAKVYSDPKLGALCTKARQVPIREWSLNHPIIKAASRALFKAGVTSSLGFNFYDLRGPAYFIFPLNTPLIQEIGKMGKVNAGVGTVANWKATRNPNST